MPARRRFTSASRAARSRPSRSSSMRSPLLEAVFPLHLGDAHAIARIPVGPALALRLGMIDHPLPGRDVFEAAPVGDGDAQSLPRRLDAEIARLLHRQRIHAI